MTTGNEPERDRPVVTDPNAGEPIDTGGDENLDTHTAALQGAAAGGAMGGKAGYAGGLMTGSEDGIGIAEIPDANEDADSAAVTPGSSGEDPNPARR